MHSSKGIDQVYRIERFCWDNAAGQQPRLVSRSLENGKGKVEFCRTFAYNDKGRLIKQTLWGDLSGACLMPLSLKQDGLPEDNGIENYSIAYRYSVDEKSQLIP